MSDAPTRDQNKFIVRMPDGMRDHLKQVAAENNRSLNAEIVGRLEESLSAERETRDLHRLLDQTFDERRQLSDIINSQDIALQTVRRSHNDLVTIAKQLGQTFLDNMEGQPAFLGSLAQMLATFEIDDDLDPSDAVGGIDWSEYSPDPYDEIERREERIERKNKPYIRDDERKAGMPPLSNDPKD